MSELEIRGVKPGLLLDEPLLLTAAGEDVFWRARYRDDDSRVWRARAERAADLLSALEPAKPSSGPIAALQSLRPVQVDVRVEAPDGRAASRAVTRRLVAEGVRLRRWRDGELNATLHLPAGDGPGAAPDRVAGSEPRATPDPQRATLLVDATGGPREAVVAALAAALLASRGLLVLTVASGPLDQARERLAAVPGARDEPLLLAALDPLGEQHGMPTGVVLPPGVGTRGEAEGGAAQRAAAWDELLGRLGAVGRQAARPG